MRGAHQALLAGALGVEPSVFCRPSQPKLGSALPRRCGEVLEHLAFVAPERKPSLSISSGLPPGVIGTALLKPLPPATEWSLPAPGDRLLWDVSSHRQSLFPTRGVASVPAVRPSYLGYSEYLQWLEAVLPDMELRPILEPEAEAAEHEVPPEAEGLSGLELLRMLAALKAPAKKRGIPALTEEEKKVADEALWGDASPDEVVVSRFSVDVKKSQLECLRPGEWLNDEVINFYYKLLQERSKSKKEGPKCWFPNSFFWTKLSGNTKEYNFKEVRRWTIKAKIDVFELDVVIFPININDSHWAMGAIDLRAKGFRYFDSMFSKPHKNFEPFLQRYLADEHKAKKGGKVLEGVEEWKLLTPESPVPQQRNGYDCGVFTCFFADYFSLDKPMTFEQDDMPDLRQRLAARVMKGSENFEPS